MPPSYGGIVGKLRHRRRSTHGPRQDIVESEFFKVCVYKNGNAHVWFKRDDLVEKVNKLLADYYGEVIPEGQTPEDDGGLFTPKTSLAKNYGFYPTPDSLADRVIEKAPLYRGKDDPPLTILEPNAGTGNLARPWPSRVPGMNAVPKAIRTGLVGCNRRPGAAVVRGAANPPDRRLPVETDAVKVAE